MANRDIVVIGASAGGLSPIASIVKELPEDLNAAVLIVWHISPHTPSLLSAILNRGSRLEVRQARYGESLERGKVYVAAPDRHLLLESGTIRLTRGPKENRFRPAIDPLFRSAAFEFGHRVIGVILSGALEDGTAGLWAVKDRGGIAVVQDPAEAEHPSMPQSALDNVKVDYCAPAAEIAPLLVTLLNEAVAEKGGSAASKELELETKIALGADSAELDIAQLGKPSEFTCPECHGSLLHLTNGKLQRYRCHTGHSFGTGSLSAELSESIEDSLWNAIRALEERVRLLKTLLQEGGTSETDDASARRMLKDSEQQADLLRRAAMLNVGKATPDSP